MPKKPGKIGSGKRISGVKGPDEASGVERTENVSKVKKTSGVGAVKGTSSSSRRQPTRLMTLAEREQLFAVIHEEAEKLFKNTGITGEQREAIENAVKMAVDSGLVESEEEDSP